MKFNIAGFTHKGTGKYVMNEDQLLINRTKIGDGELFLPEQDYCMCFVSDGVGGIQGGVYASSYLLLLIKDIKEENFKILNQLLDTFNIELIRTSLNDSSLHGCACTLSGMIATDNFTDFYHVGDSEIWLLRNDMLMKITKDEVVDPDNPQSPLTNYFGGDESKLLIDTDWNKPEILPGDIFLICSDGLFKSLNVKLVKPILSASKNVEEKVLKLKENCLSLGAEDNVSAIVVEVIE